MYKDAVITERKKVELRTKKNEKSSLDESVPGRNSQTREKIVSNGNNTARRGYINLKCQLYPLQF